MSASRIGVQGNPGNLPKTAKDSQVKSGKSGRRSVKKNKPSPSLKSGPVSKKPSAKAKIHARKVNSANGKPQASVKPHDSGRAKANWKKLIKGVVDDNRLKALSTKPRESAPGKPLSKEQRSARANENWSRLVKGLVANNKLKPLMTKSPTKAKAPTPAKALTQEQSARAKANWKKLAGAVNGNKLKPFLAKLRETDLPTKARESASEKPLSQEQKSARAKANWKKAITRVVADNRTKALTVKPQTGSSINKASSFNGRSQFSPVDHYDQEDPVVTEGSEKGKGLLGKIGDKILGDGLSGVIGRVLPKLINKVNQVTEQAQQDYVGNDSDIDLLRNEIESLRDQVANKKSEGKYDALINLLLENSGGENKFSVIRLVVVIMMLNDDAGLSVENKNKLFKVLMSDDSAGNHGFVSRVNGPVHNNNNFVKADSYNGNKDDLMMKMLEMIGYLN